MFVQTCLCAQIKPLFSAYKVCTNCLRVKTPYRNTGVRFVRVFECAIIEVREFHSTVVFNCDEKDSIMGADLYPFAFLLAIPSRKAAFQSLLFFIIVSSV